MTESAKKIVLLEKWETFVDEKLWPAFKSEVDELESIRKTIEKKQKNKSFTKKEARRLERVVKRINHRPPFKNSTIQKEVEKWVGGGKGVTFIVRSLHHKFKNIALWLVLYLQDLIKDRKDSSCLDNYNLEKNKLNKKELRERLNEYLIATTCYEDFCVQNHGKRNINLREAMEELLKDSTEPFDQISTCVEIDAKINIEKDVIPYEKLLKNEILFELIRNAIRAMLSAGGSINLNINKHGHYFFVSLEDTGPGIPAGDLGKVFDLDFTTKSERGGQGLFIVKQLVEDVIGGSIKVESEVDKGTAFTISIPEKPEGGE